MNLSLTSLVDFTFLLCLFVLFFNNTPTPTHNKMEVEKTDKAEDKRKSSKPKQLSLGPPPPKKPRKVKDLASLGSSTATTTALLSLSPPFGHSSAGSASTGTVALPSHPQWQQQQLLQRQEQQQLMQQQHQQQSQGGSVAVFSWPSTGNLAFDEVMETEV